MKINISQLKILLVYILAYKNKNKFTVYVVLKIELLAFNYYSIK